MSGGAKLTKRRSMYPTTRVILNSLVEGPKTGGQLAEILDDITPCVARTMANLRTRSGYVENKNAGGGRALYAITDLGRTALSNEVGE